MDEYPECPICLDIFGINQNHIKAPKVLKCGDSFCKECLEDIINRTEEENFLCPICKENIKKENNVDDYTTNKEIIRMVNTFFNIPEKELKNLSEKDKPIQINIAALGNCAVGKTSIFQRLSRDFFRDVYNNTIGLDVTTYYIKYKNVRYKMIFRDTAGQEKFKSITQSFLRNTDGVLFIYDISNYNSFEGLDFWYKLYKEENEKVVGLLIGNKSDCERKVNKEEAIKFAKEHELKYIETSAKLDKNLKKAIAILLEEIIESKALYNSLKINFEKSTKLEPQKLKKKGCAC